MIVDKWHAIKCTWRWNVSNACGHGCAGVFGFPCIRIHECMWRLVSSAYIFSNYLPLCNHPFHQWLPFINSNISIYRKMRFGKNTAPALDHTHIHVFYHKTNYNKILQVVKWKMKNVKMKMSRNGAMTRRMSGKKILYIDGKNKVDSS